MLQSIEGRTDDLLSLPSVHSGYVVVHPLALRSVMATVPQLAQYTIRYESPRLRVSAVLRAAATPQTPAGIAHRLREKLDTLGVTGVDVVVDAIDNGRDSAGKLTVIASRTPA